MAVTTSAVKKFVSIGEVPAIIGTVKGGEFYSVVFKRAMAKCPHCGKANKKWNDLEFCPICGAPLSKERETLAQNSVRNPKLAEIAPKGTGESSREAREHGRIKYYDPAICQYRQFYIVNVKRLKVKGVEYIVL